MKVAVYIVVRDGKGGSLMGKCGPYGKMRWLKQSVRVIKVLGYRQSVSLTGVLVQNQATLKVALGCDTPKMVKRLTLSRCVHRRFSLL